MVLSTDHPDTGRTGLFNNGHPADGLETRMDDTCTSHRPRIIISAAMSVDGKIANAHKTTAVLSSAEDAARVHRLRSDSDAILVGVNTVISDDPQLTVRHVECDKSPARIILDPRARTPPHSRIIKTSDRIKTIIVVTEASPRRRLTKLQESPAMVVVMGKKAIDLYGLLRHLANIGIKSVLVEGGGTTNWGFVRDGLFDEIIVAVSPYILGGSNAISLVEGVGFAALSDSPNLHLASAKRLGDHMVLSYKKV